MSEGDSNYRAVKARCLHGEAAHFTAMQMGGFFAILESSSMPKKDIDELPTDATWQAIPLSDLSQKAIHVPYYQLSRLQDIILAAKRDEGAHIVGGTEKRPFRLQLYL